MTETDQAGCYEIHIKGHLSQNWAARFSGMTITHTESGNTRLTGIFTDQAAVHGLLRTIRDSGIELLAINRINDQE